MADTFTAEITAAYPPIDEYGERVDGPFLFDVTIRHDFEAAKGETNHGLYTRQFQSEGGDDLTEQIKLEIDQIRDNLRAEQHADVGRTVEVTL